MSMTFDEAVQAAKQPALQAEVDAIREQYLAAPLKELHALKSQWAKQQPGFQTRLDNVLVRVKSAQPAVSPHTVDMLAGRLLRDLVGHDQFPGLLWTIAIQIDNGIACMAQFSAKDLSQRALWLSWTGTPERVRSNISGIEDRLSQLETIIADGGPLQMLIEDATRRAASVAV